MSTDPRAQSPAKPSAPDLLQPQTEGNNLMKAETPPTAGFVIDIGSPTRMTASHGRYTKHFDRLALGTFIHVPDTQNFESVASSLYRYVTSRDLPWRVVRRSRERRIYIVAKKEQETGRTS